MQWDTRNANNNPQQPPLRLNPKQIPNTGNSNVHPFSSRMCSINLAASRSCKALLCIITCG